MSMSVTTIADDHKHAAIELVLDDGGRASTGWKPNVRDCVVRAIAIAEQRPYIDVYDELSALMKRDRRSSATSARNGVYDHVWMPYLRARGWKRVECFAPGSPKLRMRTVDMPANATIICVMKGHLATVIDRRLHDTYDCSKGGERRVLSYWVKG